MATAILTEDEKTRIRYHCGYLVVNPIVSIQLGVPAAAQPQFLLEAAMNNIPDTAVGQVRLLVARLDITDENIFKSQNRLKAKELGQITLRDDEPGQLEGEYRRWAQRLADILGIPLNVYSQRFRSLAGGGGLNVPVVQ